MLLVGLTGGIGSGKSTVARMLAERGAVIIDADTFAREALDLGTPGFDSVVAAFGTEILAPDGAIDRAALGRRVFGDDGALRTLEAIVHPHVRASIARGIAAQAETDHVIVVDSPLIVETGQRDMFPVLIVVVAPEDQQVARLARRGLTEDEARSRIQAQLPTQDKAAVADVVLDNGGTLTDLETRVEGLWRDLQARAASA